MREMIMSAYAAGAESWGSALLDATGKGIILLVIAGLITVALRRAPAAARHFVWTIGVSLVVLLPFVGVIAPRWQLAILPASIAPSSVTPSSVVPSTSKAGTAPEAAMPPAPSSATPNVPPKATPLASPRKETAQSADIARVQEPAVEPQTAVIESASSPSALDWWLVVSMVWIAGACVLASRMMLGLLGTAMLARRSETVEDPDWLALTNRLARKLGITRPVTLLKSRRSGVPMTWGVFYPVILLPEDAGLWSAERRSIVLLHELAHIRRLDAMTQTIAQLATAIFWINPLVWIAARQMRTERERACDDFVLSAGMRPSAYASDLLEIVQTMGAEPGMAYAALAMARRSEFEGRLLAILDPTTRRNGLSGRAKWASVIVAIALLVPLAGMRPAARQVAEDGIDIDLTAALSALPQTPAPVTQAVRPSQSSASVIAQVVADSVNRATNALDSLAYELKAKKDAIAVAMADGEEASDHPGQPATVAGATVPGDDKETLIMIVRAAAKMTSDYEKASLLIEVLEKFVADDSLRMAFLSTTSTLSGEYERQRVLLTLLAKDVLSDPTRVAFIKTAAALTGDYSKRVVLTQFAAKHDLSNANVRAAFFSAVNTMGTGYDQQQVLLALMKRVTRLSRDEALGLLTAAKGMSSNSNKSAVLIAVAEKVGLSDDTIRKAYIDAASTLSSDSDYRRAMSAAIKPGPKAQDEQ